MTRHIQPPHLPEHRDLLDCIILIILFVILLYVLPLESAEIWWKKPGEKYWQECVVISTSVGPVYRYIPDGAVIAVRDGGVLVILSDGER